MSSCTRTSGDWRIPPPVHFVVWQLLVLESKADMQKPGQASPDDGDALALTFAQPVEPAEVEEETKRKNSATSGGTAAAAQGGCDDAIWQRSPRLQSPDTGEG
jgi:hypothetical protein